MCSKTHETEFANLSEEGAVLTGKKQVSAWFWIFKNERGRIKTHIVKLSFNIPHQCDQDSESHPNPGTNCACFPTATIAQRFEAMLYNQNNVVMFYLLTTGRSLAW